CLPPPPPRSPLFPYTTLFRSAVVPSGSPSCSAVSPARDVAVFAAGSAVCGMRAGFVHGIHLTCTVYRVPDGDDEAQMRPAGGTVSSLPLVVKLCSAVTYSPTPSRVQYHRRWQA